MSDLLKKLEDWYASNCNSDWEHTFGCRIGTLDNPGWFVEIDVEGTNMQSAPFEEVDMINRDEFNWVLCKLEGNTFKGFGGVYNLTEIIDIFFNWVHSNEQTC